MCVLQPLPFSLSLRALAASSPLYYVTALTALFESVCGIVDQHQPIVEKYYGEGKMLTVVSRLITECDNSVSQLITSWETDRAIEQMVSSVQLLCNVLRLT